MFHTDMCVIHFINYQCKTELNRRMTKLIHLRSVPQILFWNIFWNIFWNKYVAKKQKINI